MSESCCHGWTGGVEDREPVMDGDARGVLRCPACGRLDYMEQLPNEVRFGLWSEAKRRRGLGHVHRQRQNGTRGSRLRMAPAHGGVAFVEDESITERSQAMYRMDEVAVRMRREEIGL